jgi:hypothetical protein
MEDVVRERTLPEAGGMASASSRNPPRQNRAVRLRGGGGGGIQQGGPPLSSSSVPSSASAATSPSSARGWTKGRMGRKHVTNIRRINVINNFGIDGIGGGSGRGNNNAGGGNNNARGCWTMLKIAVALLMTVWFGALACIVRGAILQPHPSRRDDGDDGSSKSMDPRGAVGAATGTEAVARARDVDARSIDPRTVAASEAGGVVGPKGTKMDDPSRVEVRSNDMHAISPTGDVVVASENVTKNSKADAESSSMYDISLFGNISPEDFQLYTPQAPSCADPLDVRDVSYTLVSQLSNDRLWMVPYHCKRWGNNPMSIVVFTDRTASDVETELLSKGCSGEGLTLQTVEKTRYDPDGTEYPVNLLRNLAMSAVRTSHVVYADVDFWPSSDLFSILSNETVREKLANDPKLAAIVPVFQMQRMCGEYRDCREKNIPLMPKDKEGLLRLMERKAAYSFDPTNRGGHGSTKYVTWKKQETATFVDLPCINSNRYEPYLVFRYCTELPPFQEGFTGYGKNKMTVGLIFLFTKNIHDKDYLPLPSHLLIFCLSPKSPIPKPFIPVGDAASHGRLQIFSNRRCIPRPLSAFGL